MLDQTTLAIDGQEAKVLPPQGAPPVKPPENVVRRKLQARPNPKTVIVLVHGIRDVGAWHGMVREIAANDNTRVEIIKYGYVDALKFWFPFYFRRKFAERMEWQFKNIHAAYPNATFNVIAHSFGTYVTGRMLEKNPNIKLDKLILCGCILPRDFDWRAIRNQVDIRVNDCGNSDVWPVIANSFTWGFGDTGRTGFGGGIEDRFHDFGHGGFFTAEFVTKYWKPLFQNDNEWIDGVEQKSPPVFSWSRFFLVFQLKWILFAMFLWLFVESAVYVNRFAINMSHFYRLQFLQKLSASELSGTIKKRSDFVDQINTDSYYANKATGTWIYRVLHSLSAVTDVAEIKNVGALEVIIKRDCPGTRAILKSFSNSAAYPNLTKVEVIAAVLRGGVIIPIGIAKDSGTMDITFSLPNLFAEDRLVIAFKLVANGSPPTFPSTPVQWEIP